MSGRPTFEDMRVETCGAEVRLVFLADLPEHAQRIARDVAAKIKAERLIPETLRRNNTWPINLVRSRK